MVGTIEKNLGDQFKYMETKINVQKSPNSLVVRGHERFVASFCKRHVIIFSPPLLAVAIHRQDVDL
jgi:hypothetical protein